MENRSTWYHYKFVVTAASVDYTISHGTTEDATGSMSVDALPTVKGFYGLLGRGAGYIYFDNLEIYDYTEEITVSAPTIAFSKVDGANRIYTITNPDNSGTIYYTTAPAEEAPAVGDAAYSSTEDFTKDVTYTESGKYYAYVLHTNGTTASAVTEQTVTAGALTLAAPVFTVTNMVQATDGYYYPQVTFASNNSSLEGAPTATFDLAAPHTFTGVGSITVTASADGYTSSSSTFNVTYGYALTKTIDFGALTAEDFDADVWESATGAPRDLWTKNASAIPADVTYYKLSNTSGTAGDPDNSAVLDGITISNYYQRAPEVYIGYGLLTPYSALSGSGNYMNFIVNGGRADDYIVYNGWNGYGSGTFNTVQAGNAAFGLFRYDTMLRTIKVYSPAYVAITPANAYSTYCVPRDLDFSNYKTSISAYIAPNGITTKNDVTTIVLERVQYVAAGQGMILSAIPDVTYEVPVTTGVVAPAQNYLVGVTEDTDMTDIDGYVLGTDGDFHPVNGGTLKAGKAYLNIAPAAAGNIGILFGDEATGIENVKSENVLNGDIFNLRGQRVATPHKGLYIMQGKKVVVK